MTTRQRALLGILAAVGLVAAVLYFYLAAERSQRAELESTLATFVAGPAFSEIRARCQADAARLGSAPGADRATSRFEVFAYDGELRPADPASPAFPVDLADQMRGKLSAVDSYRSADGAGVEMGIATPWRNSPCALMLVRLASR